MNLIKLITNKSWRYKTSCHSLLNVTSLMPVFFLKSPLRVSPLAQLRKTHLIIIHGPLAQLTSPCSIISTPNPLKIRLQVQKIFLERNSNQWWLSEDALQSIRDYFILKDHNGRSSWAYRTQNGEWFKQGEFC